VGFAGEVAEPLDAGTLLGAVLLLVVTLPAVAALPAVLAFGMRSYLNGTVTY